VSNSKEGHSIEVFPLGNGRYQVAQGTARRIAYAVTAGDTWVFLDGRTYLVPTAAAGPGRASRAEESGTLTAPMPATVLAIHVTPGQRVQRDDVLMVLEAMKMELPIRAPRDGLVKTVACRPGELVQPGVTLLELEKD
jgi:3-methylcrotonyl-CoA carboxylase alpha subunit